jgi:pyroglutamyl-peptidase
MKILLTGFNRFGNMESNPSQLIVEALAKRAKADNGVELIAEVLPTEFAQAGRRIVELIRRHRPERIVCLGLAAGASAIRLERVALNLDDTEQADNAGLSHQGKLIVENGPLAYWSTLPIEKMCDELQKRGIPAVISNHAGTYVCNHVFYLARHVVELMGSGSPCGFVHLPSLAGQTGAAGQKIEGLPLEMMLDVVECCLRLRLL